MDVWGFLRTYTKFRVKSQCEQGYAAPMDEKWLNEVPFFLETMTCKSLID